MANNTNNNTSNKILVPEARQALNQMKLEIASELGLANYDNIDKGNYHQDKMVMLVDI